MAATMAPGALAAAARKPRYPYRSVKQAREAAKAPGATAGLLVMAVFLGLFTVWQSMTVAAGSGIGLAAVTTMACSWLSLFGLSVTAARRPRWPADGSPQARNVSAWNRAACQAVIPQGWAMAVAAGGCVVVGLWAGYVAAVGWPRVNPGVVGPAWASGGIAMLAAFGIAAALGNGAVRRLRDPHAVLARASAVDPARQAQRVMSVMAIGLGGAVAVLGVWLPLSQDGGLAEPLWIFAGVLLGFGGLLLASGLTLHRQVRSGEPVASETGGAAAPGGVKTDPRARGLLRLAGAGAVTCVSAVIGLSDGTSSALGLAGYGAIPGVLAALGLFDLLVRARRRVSPPTQS